ncbi:hypothetical protein HAX54_014573 [Datura stramonium]|uniref:Uncharacterized protein n=1 Tax=Datura stramonium TaxID=4076 RepID=A0ABS8TNB9_DATST|nr:hypothetical protein [Datura stramonium]
MREVTGRRWWCGCPVGRLFIGGAPSEGIPAVVIMEDLVVLRRCSGERKDRTKEVRLLLVFQVELFDRRKGKGKKEVKRERWLQGIVLWWWCFLPVNGECWWFHGEGGKIRRRRRRNRGGYRVREEGGAAARERDEGMSENVRVLGSSGNHGLNHAENNHELIGYRRASLVSTQVARIH